MGFDRATVDVSCDMCGMESEPAELDRLNRGRFSAETAVDDLEKHGWRVKGDVLTCPDCLADEEPSDDR